MPNKPPRRRAARPRPSTTARGYGAEHQAERQRRLDLLRDGDPCAQCLHDRGAHHPMYRSMAADLVLSHNAGRTGYLGLSYSRCNSSDGG